MDDIVETVQYNAGEEPHPLDLPSSWEQHKHPNGDFYFYNREWRVLTTGDVCDPEVRNTLRDTVVDLFQCLRNDPNADLLPNDFEIEVTYVGEPLAPIWMYSRSAGLSYRWTGATGLEVKRKDQFWTYVSEFPSHHATLPPGLEDEFVVSLRNASEGIANNPFSENQIARIITRYNQLAALRSQGYRANPHIAWIIGTVMPLDAEDRQLDDRFLAAVLNGLHG